MRNLELQTTSPQMGPSPAVQPSLKQRTVSGVKWQMINKIAQKVISVVTFAVLARILEPSTFGLFAMAFILIDGLQLFKSFGIDTAIIQRKANIEEAANTAYFIVQAQGLLLFLMCYLAAPLGGYFFHNHDVISVIRALGVIFIFTNFSKIPSTLLAKQMRFGVLSAIELLGSVVNAAMAIGLALFSPSVWCLVYAYVAKQITISLLARHFSGYRMAWQFNSKIAWELLGYGKYIMGLSWLWYLQNNISGMMVAKLLGATSLGYLALAGNIGNFINTHFTSVISTVMFPAYSKIQDDHARLRRVYLKNIRYVATVSLPFSIGIVCLAKELVLAVYGEKWITVVPLMQIIGFMQIFIPISFCSGAVFMGCGKPGYDFYLNLCGLIVRIPLLIVFAKVWGLTGAVYSSLIAVLLFAPISIYMVHKIVSFAVKDLLASFAPALWASLLMAGTIFAAKNLITGCCYPFLGGHYFIQLLILGVTGITAYGLSFYLLDRGTTAELKQMIFNAGKVSA